MLRCLVVLAVGLAFATPTQAQVFKPRGNSGAKSAPQKPAAAPKDDSDTKKAPAPKKAARAAPSKKAAAKKSPSKKHDKDFVEITDDDDDE